MCSLNDVDIDEKDELMIEKPSPLLLGPGINCRKCNQRTAELVLRLKDVYCRECFLLSTVHKFRAVLGKSRLVKPKECVLVGFSGSQSSVALLNLVHQGLNVPSHKRLMFRPSVIYIDEGAILGLSTDQRRAVCSSVAKIAARYEFPSYVVTLDKSLEDSIAVGDSIHRLDPAAPVESSDEADSRLRAVVESTGSPTSRADLVRVLRNNLLVAVAKHLSCSKVFVADVENDLAVRLLSDVSLGRGAQLPLDVGFCDSRDPAIQVLRPMRDFMRREVTLYTAFLGLETASSPASPGGGGDSVQALTERFVAGLQEDFPGTISTVFRTGEKLSCVEVEGGEESCCLCRAPLEAKSSAGEATDFSRLVSALGPAGFDDTSVGKTLEGVERPQKEIRQCSAPPSGGCRCHSSSGCSDNGVTWAQAEEFLCYGCRLIARELESTSSQVPNAVLRRIQEHSNYKRMREEIQDFLL